MPESPNIHPSAVVDPSAQLAPDVRVGAFSIVEPGVQIERGSTVAEHAIVRSGVRLGVDCVVDSFVVLGGQPQMRGSGLLQRNVRIGDRSILREGVTVGQPVKDGGETVVGADCYLMANSHVGHDCRVGDAVTLANNVMLAGHVAVGGGSFLGGGAGIHQFVRVGRLAMVGGNASISYDVPPFAMAAERNEIRGLNFVGLRRQRISHDVLADLKRAYHAVYSGPGDFRQRAECAIAEGRFCPDSAAHEFLAFFVGGKRGFARARRCQ
ncbi:MAG: acyl-ACP--UDP-N-acetylglucosamine O-acyltransferase [Planctomycetota bacterium]